jgi:predicted dehydrogenase
MNRRPFLKQLLQISGGTLVAMNMPMLYGFESGNKKKLGIALVGLGKYSEEQLAPALLETQHCELVAIVTGTKEKEQKWIAKYNLKKENVYNYDNFDTIVNNKNIDIVYVVLPNSMHAEFTIRAAKAGKHVICEKPMATSVADCKKMIQACKDAGKKLSIGYRLYFEPHNQEMMRLGQNRVYGKKMDMKSSFSFVLNDAAKWRTQKALAGGGPLMDLGIYCLQGCIYTFGELPTSLWAKNTTKDKTFFKDIEGSIEWEMTFPSGKAYCKTSYEEPFENYLTATTEKGELKLTSSFVYRGLKGSTPDGPIEAKEVNQQALQMDAFAQNILQDTPSIVPGEMGMRDNYIIEKIYESASKNGAVVTLEDIPKILFLRKKN